MLTHRDQTGRAGLHAAVWRNTARDSTFIGYFIAREIQRCDNLLPVGICYEEEDLAGRLGIDLEKLVLLALCRTPRQPGDVERIADYIGMSREALAGLLLANGWRRP